MLYLSFSLLSTASISKCLNLKFVWKNVSSPFYFSLWDLGPPSRGYPSSFLMILERIFICILFLAFLVVSLEAWSAESDSILAQHDEDLINTSILVVFCFFLSNITLGILYCFFWLVYLHIFILLSNVILDLNVYWSSCKIFLKQNGHVIFKINLISYDQWFLGL